MLRVVLIFVFTVITASTAWAVPVGIDTFEDGTTMGWVVGEGPNPVPPVNVSTGGPAGVDDAYLQLQALGGSGAGSRLSVFNMSQWTGDFTGVPAIGMDVNNFGPDELVLRLLFVTSPTRQSADGYRVDAGAGDRAGRQRLDPRAVRSLGCQPVRAVRHGGRCARRR